jgi:hypothetical protein
LAQLAAELNNFWWIHKTLRVTPAIAAGSLESFGNLLAVGIGFADSQTLL